MPCSPALRRSGAPADERPPPRGQAVAEEARPATEDDREYAAQGRLADRLAAAAMTGRFPGDRALFRTRY
ncbi:hypothetical protein ACWD3J_11490 [Streptomyces sp. NPDC002755]|uniref:hypothetical protein n=1 Tax=Streptomyces sp. NPDC002884 TaxID=3154544 RepID=UPI00331C748E